MFSKKNIRNIKKIVENSNNLEIFKKYSNHELKEIFNTKKLSIEELLSLIGEVIWRVKSINVYTSQLIGAVSLVFNNISEMNTGEGKSLTASIAAIIKKYNNLKVTILTVNDYLATRDLEDHMSLFDFLDISYGLIISSVSDISCKKEQYLKDIVYVNSSELVFDYLKDSLVSDLKDRVSPVLDNAIIDEIDYLLIDEASTPIILSKAIKLDFNYLNTVKKFIDNELEKGEAYIKSSIFEVSEFETKDFIIDNETNKVLLNDSSIDKIEKYFKLDNLFISKNSHYKHAIEMALVAKFSLKKDIHYLIDFNKIVLIDQKTGRASPNRKLNGGLHQALEAKESLPITEYSENITSITYQTFFKKYSKLSGLSGTAKTESEEFLEVYGLYIISIPPNKKSIRVDLKDKIFLTEEEKLESLISLVKRINLTGQPILIGTSSILENNKISKSLLEHGLNIKTLNAKNIKEENEIISQAGELNSITVATNMVGRGVDISISTDSLSLGGLYVIGYGRNENKRIDNQLKGRTGRNGNSGTSQFIISFEDYIFKVFGLNKIKNILNRNSFNKNNFIELKIIKNIVTKAQSFIENQQYMSRVNLLKYESVYFEQREYLFKIRESILLEKYSFKDKLNELASAITILVFEDPLKKEENIAKYIKFDLKIDLSSKEVFESKLKLYFNDKFSDLTDLNIRNILFDIYLSNIDNTWIDIVNHLNEFKKGVNLRQISQKDPVSIFQKESFSDFKLFLIRLSVNIFRDIYHVHFNRNGFSKAIGTPFELPEKFQR